MVQDFVRTPMTRSDKMWDKEVKKHKKQFQSAICYELHTNYYEVRKKRKFCGSIFTELPELLTQKYNFINSSL